jgi:hypothetical protein
VRGGLLVPAALAVAAAVIAGCTTPAPPSPIASIPKVIVDFQDNETRIYLTSVNADVRYANVSISLGNENLTANLSFNDTKSFALLARTNLTYFTLNATADDGSTHYFYNASVHIAERTPTDPDDAPVYQAYIREPADAMARPEALPFRHVLAAG